MTDLPRRGFRFVPPRPGGFEDAVRRSRRRRWARSGASSALALVTAGSLAAALSGSGGGTNRLDPVPPARRTRTTAVSVPPTASPAARRAVTAKPAVPGPRPVRTSIAAPVAPPRPSSAPPRLRAYAARQPITRDAPAGPADPGACLGAVDWCEGTAYLSDAEPYTLSLEVCRPAGTSDGTLDFPGREADVWVTDASKSTVWDWAKHPAATPAKDTVTVPAGQCVTWTTSWDGGDDYGTPLPANRGTVRYTLNWKLRTDADLGGQQVFYR